MLISLCSLSAFLLVGDGTTVPAGKLADPATGRTVPYLARAGDLVFFDDRSPVWTPLFTMAGTGPPLHMGIVVPKVTGGLAVLEAGPDDTLWVELLDLSPRLHQFRRDFKKGSLMIRRCKKALTPEETAALMKFAAAQKGKRYAVLRLLQQGTTLRIRGSSDEAKLAKTDLEREAWICSELAVAAGTVAGLFDPRQVRANITYPRDLVDNRRHDLSATWEDAREWRP